MIDDNITDDGTKNCGKCNQYYPISDFYRNKSRKCGLDSYCKTCVKKRVAAWVLNRPKSEEEITVQKCYRCNIEQPISNFWKDARAYHGYQKECKTCMGLYRSKHKEYRIAYLRKYHLEHKREHKHRFLKYSHNISIDQYDEMFKKQEGKCAICKKTSEVAMAVDHDHDCCLPKNHNTNACGKCVRGLLCSTCNRALGGFRDSIDSLQAAIDYLKAYQGGKQ